MTGKRIGVADIVRRVVNRADVREADHTDNEKAERHCQYGLSDNAGAGGDGGQMGGLGLWHVDPHRRCAYLPENTARRDPKFSIAG